MACTPANVVHDHILTPSGSSQTNGWVSVTSPSTSALLAHYGVTTSIITFDNVATASNQHIELVQFEIEETAATSGDLKKKGLKLMLYSNSAPSSPSTAAVYNASTTNLIGQVEVATADYKRIADTIWVATVKPNLFLRTVEGSTPSTIHAAIITTEAVTYVSGVALRVRPFFRIHTAL